MISAAQPARAEERTNSVSRGKNFLTGGLYVATHDQKDKGVFVPYPLVSILVGLLIWLAGATGAGIYAFASLSANVGAMNSTMLIRDSQNAEERHRMQGQIDILNERYNQTRIELAEVKGGKR